MKPGTVGRALYSIARPFLFAINAERAHKLTLGSIDRLARLGLLELAAGQASDTPTDLMGLRFPNRVGLAAGLDKNGAHIDAMARMGFGFIEVGTVTPRAQPGNPRPRMFRVTEHRALINRMGFNNDGVDAFLANVARADYKGILGLNIGKNADTPIERATDDYLYCLERVYPHASYVTVNISSPNTRNLRQLQDADELDRMLEALREAQHRLAHEHRRHVPLVLKIAPDLEPEQVDAISAALLRHEIDGVLATNTTTARDSIAASRYATQAGGLSGAPLLQASNRVIKALRQRLPSDYPIIGVGGILSGADAASKIAAGASLVQLYTGLIYRGPALVSESIRATRKQD